MPKKNEINKYIKYLSLKVCFEQAFFERAGILPKIKPIKINLDWIGYA